MINIDEELHKASNRYYFASQNDYIFNTPETNKLFHDAAEEHDVWLYAKQHSEFL